MRGAASREKVAAATCARDSAELRSAAMSEGNGKAAGGAAVGAGGIIAMVLKLCSHEPGVAATAARGAGEVGIVARGAGELGALSHGVEEIGMLSHGAGALVSGERGTGQIILAGVSTPVEVSRLSPIAVHTAEDGIGAARGLAPVGAKGAAAGKVPTSAPALSKAARSAKLKDALAHAADAKDALDLILDGWDLYQASLDDDDVENELNRKLSPTGLSSSDVLPAVKGEPVSGLTGATRMMLSDGHALVPAARLAIDAPSFRLTPTDVRAIAQHQGTPIATTYLEVPGDDLVTTATSLSSRLFMAEISPRLEWVELVTTGPVKLPAILEQRSHRFVRIAAGGTRVVLLRAIHSTAN